MNSLHSVQFLRFLSVGVANTAVGLSVIYFFMYFFNMDPIVANAMGYVVGGIISFILNKKLTFKSAKKVTSVLPQYVLALCISYLLNVLVVGWGGNVLGVSPYLIQIAGVMTYTVVFFLACKCFVFAK